MKRLNGRSQIRTPYDHIVFTQESEYKSISKNTLNSIRYARIEPENFEELRKDRF